MDAAWERIERWLMAHAPQVAAGLNPPASEAELAETEAALGVQFPADFRAAYLRHNGQKPDAPSLIDGWDLLSLERIRDEWQTWNELLAGGEFAGAESEGDGVFVRRDWWNPGWIPITYNGSGDHQCLDLAPGPEGTVGQIIEMWHDEGARPLLAASFGEWFDHFAEEVAAGRFEYTEETGGLCRREDESSEHGGSAAPPAVDAPLAPAPPAPAPFMTPIAPPPIAAVPGYVHAPAAAASTPGAASLGDHIVPMKNPPALVGYYLAIFSLIPCAGLLLGPAAVICGALGLRKLRDQPQLPGRAHALVAIILGTVTSLANWAAVIFMILALVADSTRTG